MGSIEARLASPTMLNIKTKDIQSLFEERVHLLSPQTVLVPLYDLENNEITFRIFLPTMSEQLFEKIEDITLEIEEELGLTIHLHPIWEHIGYNSLRNQ